MTRVQGRNIYIVDLDLVVHSVGGPECFARQCQLSKFSAVWVRMGHGQNVDSNFSLVDLAKIQAELAKVGVGMWGWHVPQCATVGDATKEANVVVKCANDHGLQGILLDAEQTEPGKHNFFLGGDTEADTYASIIQQSCNKAGLGLALSSHDQPQGKPGFPFATFLKYVIDNSPQVYYSKGPAAGRLNKSIAGYKPLEIGRNFQDRYRPVGNITIFDDVALPGLNECIKQTRDFIGLMKTNGFQGYSFWCWDEAPPGIWKTFHTTPV